jgi:hypothetical protein
MTTVYYQKRPSEMPYYPPAEIEAPAAPVVPEKKGIGSTIKGFFRAIVAPGSISYTETTEGVPVPNPVLLAPPSAPISSFQEEHTAVEARAFSCYQEIQGRAPVDRLLRANVTAETLVQAKIDLTAFYEAGYKLQEMQTLCPKLDDLRRLGVNKHFFGQRWDIKEFGARYQLGGMQLISEFQLTPQDLCNNKFTAAELGKMGLTAGDLIRAGADFQFWLQLKASPRQFAEHLRGTVTDVVAMDLNLTQKRALADVCYWDPTQVLSIPGFEARTVVKLWYGFDV